MISAGLCLHREALDLVEVDQPVLLPDAVLHGVEPLAGQVGRRTVGQVATGRQRQAENRVARLDQRQHHGLVGLGAGMRLDVGPGTAEELPGPVDRQAFGDIDELAAAVVAPARIALCVLVGQDRALRLEHGARHDVLARDQLDLVLLTIELIPDGSGQIRIGVGQWPVEEAGGALGRDGGGVVDVMTVPLPCSVSRRGGRVGRPSNSVARKVRRQSSATSGPIIRAPSASTFRVVVLSRQTCSGVIVT